ncbi:hypothetical protein [uncultured Pontibacter sp.]|uniref:hypothetical protein n=1 Tax=uncultured Pontibacter sp. TaxID=453356 RepID=UPI002632BD78|nr:hypothetical protein [uncultured Pontibacter sp.]
MRTTSTITTSPKSTILSLLLMLLIIPLCFSCKKEPVEEPLMQYHFIEFVDASGKNLLESGEISTSDFKLISGDFVYTWDEILAEKKRDATSISETLPHNYEHVDILNEMFSNDNLLLEASQGNLGGFGPREKIFSLNGVNHTFTYSSKEGFYQNGKKLSTTTDVIDKGYIFLHHIVLEDY